MTARCDECRFWSRKAKLIKGNYGTWGVCERYGVQPPAKFALVFGEHPTLVTAPDFFCAEFIPNSEESEAAE
jgi:hypothetical protein